MLPASPCRNFAGTNPAKAGTPTTHTLTIRVIRAIRGSTKHAHTRTPTHHHAAFTMIELLVVIMLLTVLMLTAFPAFRGLERTMKRHQAVAEADAIAQAALAYRRTYGQWPLEMDPTTSFDNTGDQLAYIAGDPDNVDGIHQSLDAVSRVLRGGETPDNPRAICFLELADNQLDESGFPVDPWGQSYVLVMGQIREQVVRFQEGGIAESITHKISNETVTIVAPEDVVAFSWGDPAIPNAQERVIGSWSKR